MLAQCFFFERPTQWFRSSASTCVLSKTHTIVLLLALFGFPRGSQTKYTSKPLRILDGVDFLHCLLGSSRWVSQACHFQCLQRQRSRQVKRETDRLSKQRGGSWNDACYKSIRIKERGEAAGCPQMLVLVPLRARERNHEFGGLDKDILWFEVHWLSLDPWNMCSLTC